MTVAAALAVWMLYFVVCVLCAFALAVVTFSGAVKRSIVLFVSFLALVSVVVVVGSYDMYDKDSDEKFSSDRREF